MERDSLSEIQSLTQTQQIILEQLASIQADVALLARAAGKRRLNPEYLGIDEAARLAGRSKQGLQNWIKREQSKIGGFPIRRLHGAVCRKDLLAFLEYQANQHTGRGARARAALEGIGDFQFTQKGDR